MTGRADLESLSVAEKRALAARLLARRRAPVEREHPVSFAQERLWFLDRLLTDRAAYNNYFALRLRGDLDAAAMAAAFQALVDRHQALRTRIRTDDDRPVQVVMSRLAFPLPRVDLGILEPERREAVVWRLVAGWCHRPFDLAADRSLLRALMLHLGPEEHALVVTIHHVVSDEWSLGLIGREVATLYQAARDAPRTDSGTGRRARSPLPPPPLQYIDFCHHQRRILDDDAVRRQLDHWRGVLEPPPALELPADRSSSATEERGGSVSLLLPRELGERTAAVGRTAGATLFMTLLAAYQLLLSRLTGSCDVAVGTPVTNRDREELERVVGLFVNTLVMRVEVAPEAGFRDLLRLVRRRALDGYRHQTLPFEKIVAELRPAREAHRNPYFETVFTLQAAGIEAGGPPPLPGLATEPLVPEQASTPLPLVLTVREVERGLLARFDLATDRFDRTTGARWLRHLQRLLEVASSAPETPVAELPLLTPVERHQLLREWNDAKRPYPSAAGLGELFARCAARVPESAALDFAGAVVSYRQLERRSRRLARELTRRLVRHGGGHGARVALLFDPGPDLVLATLATVRAGAVYLPLDPAYPAPRLRQMMAASGAVLLVTSTDVEPLAAFDAEMPELERVELAALEWAAAALGDTGSVGAIDAAGGDDLAYLLFTSGSTGAPKATAVPQRAVVRLVLGVDHVRLGPGDRVAQVSNVSFDAATFEIWGALLTGACLAGIPRRLLLDPVDFDAALATTRVSAMFVTAALFNQQIRHRPGSFAPLRHLLVGGEALDPGSVRAALGSPSPPSRLLNGYGPTESTTFAAWEEVRQVSEDVVSIPIGRPIANTTLQVVDRRPGPVPPGVAGELWIGGDGLAWGYPGRPGLTAERFVPDPFDHRHGRRLYRTGDLARWLADGRVDYLGRLDRQVKVRGFRIEPGEIEVVLGRHPGVRQASVVALREGGPASAVSGLRGCVVPDPEVGVGVGELRRWLAEELPEYLVPGEIVLLDALPLTANGKLDRDVLAALEPEPSAAAEERPATSGEGMVAELLGEVLGRPALGPHDDFFKLGGHSLLATRVVTQLRERLGVELPLRAVFESPTPVALAARVERAWRRDVEATSGPPPLRSLPRGRPFPLSFQQERLWLLGKLAASGAAYNVPLALRLRGELDGAALARAWSDLMARHEVLRTRLGEVDGAPVQLPGSGPATLCLHLDLDALPEARRRREIRRLARRLASRSFDLVTEAPAWAVLCPLAAGEHALLVTLHHVACDEWSLGVLFRDLLAAYDARRQGRAPELPPLPVQYADYAAWQRGWLESGLVEALLEHPRRRLASLEPLELPTDRPRPPVQSFRGAAVSFTLTPERLAAVRALGRDTGTTLFMTLLAGFQALLGQWSGRRDLAVGSPVAHRTRGETEELVGFFVNMLVLRAELADDPTVVRWLERTRAAALDAFAHQDVPFERLVAAVAAERDLSRHPLFQVSFQLMNAPAPVLELPGLEVEDLETGGPSVVKFDLSLAFAERDGSLAGTLEYSRDLFDHTTVRRLLRYLDRLLAAMAEAPERRISELPILDAAERHQLAVEWNDWPLPGTLVSESMVPGSVTADTMAVESTLARVAHQTSRCPDAVAVTVGEVQLSYGELSRRASGLARRLTAAGVGPEARVAVSLGRTPEMVIALLAVLKAGAAYLPLDLSLPPARLTSMVVDSGAVAVVTSKATQEKVSGTAEPFPIPVGVPRVPVVGSRSDADSVGVPAAAAGFDGERLAYVIYTSGSTGAPKGVAVRHRGLANLVAWHLRRYGVGPEDRASHLAGLGFDASVWELWPYLAAGARVELADEAVRLSPERLVGWLAERRITVAFLPTPLAEATLDRRWPPVPALRHLLTGGDRLRRRPPAKLPFPLLNHYGPTEGSVVATAGPVLPAGPDTVSGPSSGGTPSENVSSTVTPDIGRPIAGAAVYLFDRRLRPVAVGSPGRLFLGGDGLARGYLGDPRLTAEHFVPDPASDAGESGRGGRLYETGDLARHRADGRLDFLGRADQQVKLRGFRVEPAEIESALTDHPAVGNACMTVDRSGGEPRLVAYVVPGTAKGTGTTKDTVPGISTLDPEELARHLRSRLPSYMVPAAWHFLDALPLTANGKVDRQRLPSPSAPEAGAAPAEEGTEALLARLWSELLGVPSPSPSDDFFALGGHSLHATQLVSRLRRELRVELPLAAVFEAPTLAGLAARVEGAVRGEELPLPPIRRRPPGVEVPLSYAQQRLWFLDQLAPGNSFYNVPMALRLTGKFVGEAFHRALAALAERHETLRTVLPAQGGEPRQEVREPGPPPLLAVDLRGLPPACRDPAGVALVREEISRPFDLARGPLWRALLIVLEVDRHLLVLNFHHVISDGWSMGVMGREVTQLYCRFSGAGAQPLPELPVQYGDFALEQRRALTGTSRDALLERWRRQLEGAPTVLELTGDRPRPQAQSHRGGVVRHRVPFLAELESLGWRAGGTLFMVLSAAWAALLARHAGQDDLLLGTPIANRRQASLEPLVGFFVNTLVLRFSCLGELPFSELLDATRRTALTAYAHQDLPFEMLVEEVAPERDLSRAPLVQALFVLQNAPLPSLELPGLEIEPVGEESPTAKFDLALTATPFEGGLATSLRYSSDLFDAVTVERLIRRYRLLLAGVLEDSEAALGRLPLLSRAERHVLLADWNDTTRPLPGGRFLHDFFLRPAALHPERTAVAMGPAAWSYGELDRRSAALARRLRGLGVCPEVAVGIAFDRSFEMVLAVVGVLRAGGVCVPLDPTLPAERLGFLIADAGVRVLLAGRGVRGRLPATGDGVTAVELDGAVDEPGPESGGGAESGHHPDHLAYVIYTSGSTGRPKGVAMAHRPLANLIAWQCSDPVLGQPGRRLQFASLGFDGAFREIFATWGSGSTLVLVPETTRSDVAALVEAVAVERIEKLLQPAVLLRLLAEEGRRRPGSLASLREVMVAGEQVQITDDARELFGAVAPFSLHNHYGPTESHVVTAGPLAPRPAAWPDLPDIGWPITNARVHLLDRRAAAVPLGVAGELALGGASPARGYLGRPALTAERFIPDPYVDVDGGGRLYCTGDLARRDGTGRIHFLGRIDHQVKIRGHRVEPGEVESVLGRASGVAQAVVVACPEPSAGGVGSGRLRLVAYLVAEAGGEAPPVAELRRFLGDRLPESMVPSAFMVLDELPLSPNRKVDRRALPEPTAVPRSDYEPPRTGLEAVVAEVWGELLDRPRLGVHDDFFELGGHSLLATQAIARLRERLDLATFPLRVLFERPTVAGLAAALGEALSEPAPRPLPPIERQPPRDAYPLSPAQERLWFLYQLDPRSTGYNTIGVARLVGELDPAVLEAALAEIVRRHGVLRATFEQRESGPVQRIAPPHRPPLPVVDLARFPGERAAAVAEGLIRGIVAYPFDLERGPVLRLLRLRLGAGSELLVVSAHHIVTDGWSRGIFLRELTALYDAFHWRRPSPLPELWVSYVDFACWQREWLTREVMREQLDYWLERLLPPLPVLDLPTDRSRPAVSSFAGGVCPWSAPAGLTEGLRQLARSHSATLYATLLAAFATLLHRYSWQDDLLVGCPIANRTRVDIEPLIGFFVNTLVQRIDLSGGPTFSELLGRVRDVTLDSQAHQDVPFERLVEALAPRRDLRRNPLVQVSFQVAPASLVTLEESAGTAGELRFESYPFEEARARFDLALALVEAEHALSGRLYYSSELFEPETVERLLERFERLLEGVVADPRRPLLDYPLDDAVPSPEAATESAAPAPAAVELPEDDFAF